MSEQDINYGGYFYNGLPHTGVFSLQPIRLVVIGRNKESKRQIVREKRYFNRNKYVDV